MKKNKGILMLLILQFILTISTLVVMILPFFIGIGFYIVQLLLGITLLVMGINQFVIYKKKKMSILYFVIGLGTVILAVLSKMGVV